MSRLLKTDTGFRDVVGGSVLLLGIVMATLTDAVASTVLALGRGHIIGDTYTTPDEFAWLDIGYTSAKLISFVTVPWILTRIDPRHLLLASIAAMGAASGFAAVTTRLDLLVFLRVVEGIMGGAILVVGQAVIFVAYPRKIQPILQALFAIGAVVAPGTVAPALQGWLIDSQSWTWIFISIMPPALAALGILLFAENFPNSPGASRRFDLIGFLLISIALFCFTYVLSQGSRWDWLEESRILCLGSIGLATMAAFVVQQIASRGRGLIDLSIGASEGFCFAFIVSFVAGAALLGSGYLIPSFAISVLAFTSTDAGQLLLPSGGFFTVSLLIAAFLVQGRGFPPIATIPLGILMIITAMWLLSWSTVESGAGDMLPGILLRGFGLGFLFLSINLVAFGQLTAENISSGIGLFNAGRQFGGLVGVAGLQTVLDHQIVGNLSIIGASLTPGTQSVADRIAFGSSLLAGHGMNPGEASVAATALLVRSATAQSTVIAFNTAFNSIALLFVCAVPVIITIRVLLVRRTKARSAVVPAHGGS